MSANLLRKPVAAARLDANKLSRPSARTLFMSICCLAMVGGTGLVIASAPAGSSMADRFWLAAPLIGCVAMHLLMHRFMGKCAHTGGKTGDKTDD